MKTAGISSFAKAALQSAALLGASTLAAGVARSDDLVAASATDAPDEQIVVTGATQKPASERYVAPLADTPRSVTVIPQRVIQQTGVTNLQEALRVIPGITLGSGEGGTSAGDRPFIRGIDSTNDIFVDGIRDSGSTTREVFDLEQIDVSRGPGGAYSGRGGTGGAINLVSKTAGLDDFRTSALSLGGDNTVRVTADANQMLGQHSALRINFMDHDADVAGRDDVELHRWGAAANLTFGLSTDTRVTLNYYHLQTDDVPDYGIPYLRQPTIVDPIYGPIVFATPVRGHDDDFYGLLNRDFRKTQADIATFRIDHAFNDNLSLANTTRYGQTNFHQVVTNPDDSRGNVANGFVMRSPKSRGIDVDTFANVTDLHGRHALFGWKNSFDAGVEYSNEQTHNQNYAVNGPGLPATFGFPLAPTSGVLTNTLPAEPNCTNLGALAGASAQFNCTTLSDPNAHDPWVGAVTRSVGFTDTTTEVYAAYAFDNIEFNQHWSLNWGVRYDNYQTRQTGLTAPAPTATVPNPTLSAPAPLSRQDDFINYNLGLVFKPAPQGTIYVAYGTSTDPSGEGGGDASTLSAAISILPPEANKGLEAGLKWQFFGERLLTTLAVFHTEKTNARVVDDTGLTDTIGNQQVDGVEVTASGRITNSWSVFGGYTYLDSEVKDGGFFDRGVAATPRFVPSPANGNEFPNTPRNAFSLWTDYALTNQLSIGGGASYMSRRFADANNRITIPSYWRYDAVASYRVDDHFDLQLNLQNLTDERYVTNPFQTHMAQIAAGRSALLQVNVRY